MFNVSSLQADVDNLPGQQQPVRPDQPVLYSSAYLLMAFGITLLFNCGLLALWQSLSPPVPRLEINNGTQFYTCYFPLEWSITILILDACALAFSVSLASWVDKLPYAVRFREACDRAETIQSAYLVTMLSIIFIPILLLMEGNPQLRLGCAAGFATILSLALFFCIFGWRLNALRRYPNSQDYVECELQRFPVSPFVNTCCVCAQFKNMPEDVLLSLILQSTPEELMGRVREATGENQINMLNTTSVRTISPRTTDPDPVPRGSDSLGLEIAPSDRSESIMISNRGIASSPSRVTFFGPAHAQFKEGEVQVSCSRLLGTLADSVDSQNGSSSSTNLETQHTLIGRSDSPSSRSQINILHVAGKAKGHKPNNITKSQSMSWTRGDITGKSEPKRSRSALNLLVQQQSDGSLTPPAANKTQPNISATPPELEITPTPDKIETAGVLRGEGIKRSSSLSSLRSRSLTSLTASGSESGSDHVIARSSSHTSPIISKVKRLDTTNINGSQENARDSPQNARGSPESAHVIRAVSASRGEILPSANASELEHELSAELREVRTPLFFARTLGPRSSEAGILDELRQLRTPVVLSRKLVEVQDVPSATKSPFMNVRQVQQGGWPSVSSSPYMTTRKFSPFMQASEYSSSPAPSNNSSSCSNSDSSRMDREILPVRKDGDGRLGNERGPLDNTASPFMLVRKLRGGGKGLLSGSPFSMKRRLQPMHPEVKEGSKTFSSRQLGESCGKEEGFQTSTASTVSLPVYVEKEEDVIRVCELHESPSRIPLHNDRGPTHSISIDSGATEGGMNQRKPLRRKDAPYASPSMSPSMPYSSLPAPYQSPSMSQAMPYSSLPLNLSRGHLSPSSSFDAVSVLRVTSTPSLIKRTLAQPSSDPPDATAEPLSQSADPSEAISSPGSEPFHLNLGHNLTMINTTTRRRKFSKYGETDTRPEQPRPHSPTQDSYESSMESSRVQSPMLSTMFATRQLGQRIDGGYTTDEERASWSVPTSPALPLGRLIGLQDSPLRLKDYLNLRQAADNPSHSPSNLLKSFDKTPPIVLGLRNTQSNPPSANSSQSLSGLGYSSSESKVSQGISESKVSQDGLSQSVSQSSPGKIEPLAAHESVTTEDPEAVAAE
eukprot:gb/GEZN01000412.1/.p1 GENE.gb/GEZN01000412.1/~~gb/GEZN01000412.1/.p1  ORF type:complete len:1279 (-),score=98.09 gb/GEZN01000412.1/:697-4074(-)